MHCRGSGQDNEVGASGGAQRGGHAMFVHSVINGSMAASATAGLVSDACVYVYVSGGGVSAVDENVGAELMG